MDFEKEINELKSEIECLKGIVNSIIDERVEQIYSDFNNEERYFEEGIEMPENLEVEISVK